MANYPLETKRLLLRNWRDADRDSFYSLNSDPAVMRFFPSPLTRAESDTGLDYIRAHFDSHGFGIYAAELSETGQFAGFIGLNIPEFDAPFMPCVEVAWRLNSAFWNRGLATEGARAVVHHAFGSLGIAELVAFTVPANWPSRRVMEKLGMIRDSAGDFDHPRIAPEHPLSRHVLYRLSREQFSSSS